MSRGDHRATFRAFRANQRLPRALYRGTTGEVLIIEGYDGGIEAIKWDDP
jgi:hypothetical protein